VRSQASVMALLFSLTFTTVARPGDGENATGTIRGRISPEDASVLIIAKVAGTAHEIKENVKGEVLLERGGDFAIEGLPPGTYDLLFFLKGESQKKYLSTRWSEVRVTAGKTTSGIDYRLTPRGSPHLIDEVLVGFAGMSDADARKTIGEAGCIVKDEPLVMDDKTTYIVDIPDDKSVADMLELFGQKPGVEYVVPNAMAGVE
jgi:hypothetical protein